MKQNISKSIKERINKPNIKKYLTDKCTKRYVLTEPVISFEQAQKEIVELLEKTATEWTDYLENGAENIATKNLKLGLSFRDETKKNKARQILTWIHEAQENKDYQQLFEKWSDGAEYNNQYDFDGSLYLLKKHLEIKDDTIISEEQNI